MKNQKGVTLIALVVTIIVLIILAGVSIAILTGDNGIINNAKKAQQNQIEGEVRDLVTMAVASAKLKAESNSVTTSSGFSAQTDVLNSSGDIMTELRTVLPTADYDITATAVAAVAASGNNPAVPAHTDVTITYKNSNYASATNAAHRGIQVVVTVTHNAFSVGTYNYNFDLSTLSGS